MATGRGGMGSHKHYVSGKAGKSPKLRHAMKRDAEKNEIKATGRIKNPASSVEELFRRKR